MHTPDTLLSWFDLNFGLKSSFPSSSDPLSVGEEQTSIKNKERWYREKKNAARWWGANLGKKQGALVMDRRFGVLILLYQ